MGLMNKRDQENVVIEQIMETHKMERQKKYRISKHSKMEF